MKLLSMVRKACLGVAFLFICTSASYGQVKDTDKTLDRANKLFEISNYPQALQLYLEVQASGAGGASLSYRIGKCYRESNDLNKRLEGIPYYENALQDGLEPIPGQFYLDLGILYMEDEQIGKAIDAFETQQLRGENEGITARLLNQKISCARTARKHMSLPRKVQISKLNHNVNTPMTEYSPLVSADEGVLVYTAMCTGEGGTQALSEQIFMSVNENGNWSDPEKIEIRTERNYGTAGIAADGHVIFVFIGNGESGDLFTMKRSGETWDRPIPLGSTVNSRFMETAASITPDGKTLYIASDRPGGYGGLDLYCSRLQDNGTWSEPVNMGAAINTEADEDAPFIHPNGTMLFFASDGHETMGGNDIFRTVLEAGTWTKPENLGYPINTTANESYFSLIADGSRGYFSSDRKGGFGGQDIYMMDMPGDFETIPLTLIKGRIVHEEEGRPVNSRIYMIDKETNQKLDYVYHPDPYSGDYLVILPPNKNYDMIIESDGYLPYTLNIDVPDQTRFYELYQQITQSSIRQFDVVVGQEVHVNNAFYDSNKERRAAERKRHEAELVQSDSIDVYELMGSLIEAGDQQGIDYLVSLILMDNPIDAVFMQDEDNHNLQSARRMYYYDESDESNFEKRTVDGETIYSLPTMYVTRLADEQAEEGTDALQGRSAGEGLPALKVLFAAGSSDLDPAYHGLLDTLLSNLKADGALGVEISGYASSDGDELYNRELSNNRAISVLDYFNHRGIVRRRIIARGYGENQAAASREESRRVEVKIVRMIEPGS